MLPLWLVLGTLLIALVIGLVLRNRDKKQKLPPGPKGLPVIGNVHQILKNFYLKISVWAIQHGKCYTIYLAGKPALVVNDVPTMKKIFGTMSSTGKFYSDLMDTIYQGSNGVVNCAGERWLEQRQFFMKVLHEVGFGRDRVLEQAVLEECDDLCVWIQNQMKSSHAIYMEEILLHSSGNTLWTMVTGQREKAEDSKRVKLLVAHIHSLQQAAKSGLAFFSWIKYLAPEWSGYNRFLNACKIIHDTVEANFEQHRMSRQNESRSFPEDVIDFYIEQVEKCKKENSTFYGKDGWRHSMMSVVSLLLAGSETTASTISWLIFYLSVHSQVQRKLQEEIDSVVGNSRDPSLLDKPRMPYMEAVILESLRFSSLLPFGLIHELLEDIQFEEYLLPKGMLLIPNLYHVHYNKEIWGDPEKFRPERFLEGTPEKIVRLKECVVPFQPGKRSCPGEPQAKHIIFLVASRLLQKFSFYPDPCRDAKEYLKPLVGYLLQPPHLPVVVKQRKE